jgi:hypothetical protein
VEARRANGGVAVKRDVGSSSQSPPLQNHMAPHGIHCSLGTQVLLDEVNTRLRPSDRLTWDAASALWGGRSEEGEHDWLYHTCSSSGMMPENSLVPSPSSPV